MALNIVGDTLGLHGHIVNFGSKFLPLLVQFRNEQHRCAFSWSHPFRQFLYLVHRLHNTLQEFDIWDSIKRSIQVAFCSPYGDIAPGVRSTWGLQRRILTADLCLGALLTYFRVLLAESSGKERILEYFRLQGVSTWHNTPAVLTRSGTGSLTTKHWFYWKISNLVDCKQWDIRKYHSLSDCLIP